MQLYLFTDKQIGVGEGNEDFQVLNKYEFVDSFLSRNPKKIA